MTSFCDDIQEKIAAEGKEALAELERKHLEDCGDCALFVEALDEVDAVLPFTVQPSEELVSETIRKVLKEARSPFNREFNFDWFRHQLNLLRRFLGPQVTIARFAVLLMGIAVGVGGVRYAFKLPIYTVGRIVEDSESRSILPASRSNKPDSSAPTNTEIPSISADALSEESLNYADEPSINDEFQKRPAAPPLPRESEMRRNEQSKMLPKKSGSETSAHQEFEAFGFTDQVPVKEHDAGLNSLSNVRGRDDSLLAEQQYALAEKQELKNAPSSKTAALLGKKSEDLKVAAKDADGAGLRKRQQNVGQAAGEASVFGGGIASSMQVDGRIQFPDQAADELSAAGAANPMEAGKLKSAITAPSAELSSAQEFLKIRNSTAGLTFQNAYGYWLNTYVPGDREARELEMQLSSMNPSELGFGSKLTEGFKPSMQPFDSPQTSAMAVYLSSDKSSVDGPSRVLLQVGLKGTSRSSGRRPAMNIGLILDLRGAVSPEAEGRMKSLVEEFMKSKEIGDTYSITLAGRDGGTVIKGEDFRHGPVTLKLQEAFSKSLSNAGLSLSSALEQSLSELSLTSDPNSPLGSSEAIIITANSVGSELPALSSLAHKSAVSGIPVSVFGVGTNASPTELNQLALAGQGTRRLVASDEEAAEGVKKELASVSRTVARAVRVRIKLAPGVKLVSVPGSYQLSDSNVDKVRESEQAIDRKLAQNLGIESDRGEDEDGIQIVIPAFYAEDSHVITLDAVVPGPGPVAEVSLKYKDLVFLKNGTSQANLAIGKGSDFPGALNVNVTKNYLAHGVSQALTAASEQLMIGNSSFAATTLREQRTLLSGLQKMVPGLDRDPDISNDIALLDEYINAIDANRFQPNSPRSVYIANSLRLSGIQNINPETSNFKGE